MRFSPRVLLSLLSLLLVMAGTVAVATPEAEALSTSEKKSFITKLVGGAQDAQRATGIPASVLIAHAIDTSNWGTSAPASKAKNVFSRRCSALDTAGFRSLAIKQVGKPYVLGAEAAASNPDPAEFDCSELVEWLYARAGTTITDLAAAQYNATSAVSKNSSPKVGDLVFLRNNPARSNGIGHVAVLTKKLSNGDWEIVEARGRAYGVVKTTLSYWKQRSFYAGLRRYSKLVFAGTQGTVKSSTPSLYQSGCVAITSGGSTIRYRSYSSYTNAFMDWATTVEGSSAYAGAMSSTSDVNAFVDAYAKAAKPSSAASWAKTLKKLIADYDLDSYDVVPFTIVMSSGRTGAKVSALQLLLADAGISVKTTGSYDSQTVKAVKAYQKAKGLTSDGEAGPKTLNKLISGLKTVTSGKRADALHTLLRPLGLGYTVNSVVGVTTTNSLKTFQASSGLTATGTVTANTWRKLFMAVEPAATPKVSGTLSLGSTLTAVRGKWGPGSITYRYQWYRNGAAISGATGKTYVVTAADTTKTLSVRIQGSRAGWTAVALTSASTSTIPKSNLTSTTAPTISGKTKARSILTAKVAKAWGPGKVTLSYQWKRAGNPIPGATKSTYTLIGADAGKAITVTVTGTQAGYNTKQVTSKATAVIEKGDLITTPKPTISGTTKVGQTLSATAGTWTPGRPTFTYQWYRGTTAIKGATAASYQLQAADLNQTIRVGVTGNLSGYNSVTTESAATGKVQIGTLGAVTPTISGSAKVGATLTAKAGSWKPANTSLSYQWYRNGTAIGKATKSTYQLTSSDLGKTITVTVSGKLTGFHDASKTSKATAKVATGTLKVGKVTISGTAASGKTLKANPGTWGPGTVTLSYQWFRDGSAISKANKSSYKTTKADKGHKVTVRVRGTKAGFTTANKSASVNIAK